MSKKTPFFIVTAVQTSNLIYCKDNKPLKRPESAVGKAASCSRGSLDRREVGIRVPIGSRFYHHLRHSGILCDSFVLLSIDYWKILLVQ
jgi:hypothetical protein